MNKEVKERTKQVKVTRKTGRNDQRAEESELERNLSPPVDPYFAAYLRGSATV